MGNETVLSPGVVAASSQPGGATDINMARDMLSDFSSLLGAAAGDPAQIPATVIPQAAPLPQAPAAIVSPVPPAPAVPAPDALRGRFSGAVPPPVVAAPDAASEFPETPPLAPGQVPDQQQNHTWAKLRYEAKTYRLDAADKTAKLQALEAEKAALAQEKAAIEAERQAVIKERDTFSERLGKVSLAESPQFQERFDVKIAGIEAKLAQDLVKLAGEPPERATQTARKLMRLNPEDLAQALEGAQPLVLGKVMARAEEAASLEQQRELELTNWRQTSASLGVQEAKAQVVRSAEERRSWADTAIDVARQSGHPVFAAQDPQAREAAQRIAEEAHGFIQTATEEELVRAAVEGYANPMLYDVINSMAEENRQLRDRLAGGFRSMSPPVSAAPGYAPPAPPAAPQANVVAARPSDDPRAMATAAAFDAVSEIGRMFGPRV
jgi:cytochrome c556